MNKADAAYFSNKALSKSAIDLLLECPALYKAWLEGVDDEQGIQGPFLRQYVPSSLPST